MRANTAWLWIALIVAAAVAGCSTPEPLEPAPLYRGTMSSGCAPHDAPSTVLRLEAAEEKVWVFFNLWPAEGVVPPSTVRFGADQPKGQGAYCTGPDICERAEWGEVVLAGASDTVGVRGEWTLGTPDGQVHRGTFEAEWLAIQALCG